MTTRCGIGHGAGQRQRRRTGEICEQLAAILTPDTKAGIANDPVARAKLNYIYGSTLLTLAERHEPDRLPRCRRAARRRVVTCTPPRARTGCDDQDAALSRRAFAGDAETERAGGVTPDRGVAPRLRASSGAGRLASGASFFVVQAGGSNVDRRTAAIQSNASIGRKAPSPVRLTRDSIWSRHWLASPVTTPRSCSVIHGLRDERAVTT